MARKASAGDTASSPPDPQGDRAEMEQLDRLLLMAVPRLVRSRAAAEAGRLYRSVMSRVEAPLLREALALAQGNQVRTARLLGINRNTLRKRLRALGLLPARGDDGAGTG